MEKKRSNMARIAVLKIQDLRLDEPRLKKPHDEDFLHKQRLFIKKYGQFVIPIVALVEGSYRIIDGLGFVRNFKSCGFEELHCNLVSEEDISVRDFITFRIFFNIKRTKLDHIAIAEIISTYFKNKQDFKQLGNRTNISEDDIEKYAKLLEFDWDEFARKPIGSESEQMTFFDLLDNEEIF